MSIAGTNQQAELGQCLPARLLQFLSPICVHLRLSAAAFFLFCLASQSLCPFASAEDRAIITTGNDNAGRRTLIGKVIDYNGKELVFEQASGQSLTVPTARVMEVTSPGGVAEQEASLLAREHKYEAAIEQYRKAMSEEQRAWVRRRILADAVTCYENAGQIDRAGDTFLSLLKVDEHHQYFDRIPLAWLSGLASSAVEQRAKTWLANTASPPAMLLGASWSLGGAQRNAALAALRKLANDPDPRIAHLAEAQQWRANINTVGKQELDAWERQIERMPQALRVGPYLLLAKGLASQESRELKPVDEHRRAAAWNYLRAPILFPERHALAAQGLEAAAGELMKLQDIAAALALYRELASDYHDTPSGQVAEQQLKKLSPNK